MRLYRGKKFITSVTSSTDTNLRELCEKLRDKINLNLNYGKLLIDCVYKKCEWCGKEFDVTETNRYKYCSDKCSKEAKSEKDRLSSIKRIKQTKELKRTIVYETITNKGCLPEGFTEFDDEKTLGESNLTEHMKNDFTKEEKVVSRELKRLGLNPM